MDIQPRTYYRGLYGRESWRRALSTVNRTRLADIRVKRICLSPLNVNPLEDPTGSVGREGVSTEGILDARGRGISYCPGILFYESSHVSMARSAAIRWRILNYVHGG